MMKKCYLLMVLLALISCQESQKEINGFGGFDIGSDLSSHEKFAALRNTMPDEYYCNSIKLSEAIGEVSNLSITTENGKIIEVKFSSSENTNIDNIQKQLKTLKKAGKEVNFNNELNFKSYTTIDKKILFMAMENKNELLKNGKPKQEFIYSNKKTVDDGH
ncbi:hypothetical protein [Flavobacterium cheonhonense]|jgi:hypothetical protein|nr:hypothetical protein [Flavobacterium cheonhonense]